MMRQSTIAIIGAPMDLGAGRRGVDMGPSAIRVANIHSRVAALGYKVEDLGLEGVVCSQLGAAYDECLHDLTRALVYQRVAVSILVAHGGGGGEDEAVALSIKELKRIAAAL
jgi:arginase family enzyme